MGKVQRHKGLSTQTRQRGLLQWMQSFPRPPTTYSCAQPEHSKCFCPQLNPCLITALDLGHLQPERRLHQGTQNNLVLGQSSSATAHFSTNAQGPCELLQVVKSSSITGWGLQRQGAVFNCEGQWELALEAATAQPLAPTQAEHQTPVCPWFPTDSEVFFLWGNGPTVWRGTTHAQKKENQLGPDEQGFCFSI